MSDDNKSKDQFNLFNQPFEALVEVACTVERAATLVGRSKASIYRQLRQNQPFRRDIATGRWSVYPTGRNNGSIIVTVAFAPTDKSWRVV